MLVIVLSWVSALILVPAVACNLGVSWKAVWLALLLELVTLLIFISTRHVQLLQNRGRRKWRHEAEAKHRGVYRRPNDYFLFVLGSGGHTKEMLMIMDDGFCNFDGFHRRYLISSGDAMSNNHLEDYEADLKELCRQRNCSPGTYDKHTVTRARRVHQPLWSTPFTALRSVVDIFPILLSPPASVAAKGRRFPSQVFSNGPATGLFVAVAVHALKLFYVVPEDQMSFIYIESWARITSLSLTGKLLYHAGLADVLVAQHGEVAAKYGIPNVGPMVFNSRRG
ncbi:glycosyltransferase family protein [Stachybotrys elegans]|uniref:UDP-N-acetylglucosamine transferase subunit ALG14 n=1 Tax=Stachybotrys elegans TaxID=80388 RepID=A0A8K0WS21_9HYPO|nr:glycosyltransferase family protein [Stachybotrys elegans]